MAALEDSWDVDTEEKCDLNCKAQRQYALPQGPFERHIREGFGP